MCEIREVVIPRSVCRAFITDSFFRRGDEILPLFCPVFSRQPFPSAHLMQMEARGYLRVEKVGKAYVYRVSEE